VLRARSEAVEALGAGIAHEIRNPLNALSLNLQLLRERVADPDASRADLLAKTDAMLAEMRRLDELVTHLLEVSRGGYLSAIGTSAYSLISLLQHLGPMLRPGAAVASLTYMASERAIPGYGGGMSSAKAALESDTRVLAYEAGRKWGTRVNTVSAGPYASRAASAIGIIGAMVKYCEKNSALPQVLEASEVGAAMAFLCSPLASGITGSTVYVDKGYHSMGMAVDGATVPTF
jgi:enoyl-[acyl-carrier protein] reductase I